MTELPTPAIARLASEILLEIFEFVALYSQRSLCASIRCCKKWRLLASSILYRHVVLDAYGLDKFVTNHAICEVTSLTVEMGDQIWGLGELGLFIGAMKPRSVSISNVTPFPEEAASEIASIVKSLPESCTGLEIDIKRNGRHDCCPFMPPAHHHLCDSIRAILPQLKHLRLRIPKLCASMFSDGPSCLDSPLQAIHTPRLKTCLINISLREPREYTPRAMECPGNYLSTAPSAPSRFVKVLKHFARRNSSTLDRLWVMDMKSGISKSGDYSAWIRRDFILNESYSIPLLKVSKVTLDTIVVRVPSLMHPKGMEDWVSSVECGEAAAEGGVWSRTCTGARLPTQDLKKPLRSILSEDKSIERDKMHCSLWINEGLTGEVTLPPRRGKLLQRWDIREITPPGWKRDRDTGLMVRE